tara:strand:- start:30 stop:200 length:171 start_codon:yes stop_codon:yes gene_type:complete
MPRVNITITDEQDKLIKKYTLNGTRNRQAYIRHAINLKLAADKKQLEEKGYVQAVQ